jgi:hypothetical protein
MKIERNISAESRVDDPDMPLQLLAGSAPLLPARLVHAAYLAAIALATFGWLWLIAWILFRLV